MYCKGRDALATLLVVQMSRVLEGLCWYPCWWGNSWW